MTRKEEILAEICQLEMELRELTSVKYVLDSSGSVLSTKTDPYYELAQGNLFETQEAAKRERDRRALIKELRDKAGGYKPVWDGHTENYHIIWGETKKFIWDNVVYIDVMPRSGYFKEPIDGLIKEYGDRLNLLRDV